MATVGVKGLKLVCKLRTLKSGPCKLRALSPHRNNECYNALNMAVSFCPLDRDAFNVS